MSNAITSHSIVGPSDIKCKVDYYRSGDEIYGLIMRLPTGNTVSASPAYRVDGSDTLDGAAYNVKKFVESSDFNRWLRGELR
ncbi:hypothetical protein ACX93W_01880 [Paenibacillus sp. CAU 1782]